MWKKRLIKSVEYLFFLGISVLLILLLLEGGLRLFTGHPYGWFYFQPLSNTRLWRPNATIHMVMGPIPYTVRTNSLGFRGPEITRKKPAGTTRIVAIGDSVTDGFYVDNEDTWPYLLEQMLRKKQHQVEVVNASRGNSSIDREFGILRSAGIQLEPDLVLLTFVTNDLDNIRNCNREDLLTLQSLNTNVAAKSEALFLARTALGEVLLDLSLRQRFKNYRRYQRGKVHSKDRYTIPGNRDYQKNVQYFMKVHVKACDSALLYDPLTPWWLNILDNYLYALDALNRYCTEHGCRLLFSYFPSYNQIHDPDASLELRDRLQAACHEMGIPFLDLTPVFREAVKQGPLHLAPVDYHPNPAGNRVIAHAVADFLENGLLPEATRTGGTGTAGSGAEDSAPVPQN